MKKYNSAITLVALIITIVVMLILAGISLNMLFGENGIIEKAKLGKTKFLGEDAREVVEERVAALRQEQAQNGTDTSLFDFWFMYNGEPNLATYDEDMYIYLFTDELGAKLKPTVKTTTARYNPTIEYKSSIVIYKDYVTVIDKTLTVANSTLSIEEVPEEQVTGLDSSIPQSENHTTVSLPTGIDKTLENNGVAVKNNEEVVDMNNLVKASNGTATSSSQLRPSANASKAFDGNKNGGADDYIFHAADYIFNNNGNVWLRMDYGSTSKKIYKAIWYGRGTSYNYSYYQTPNQYKFQASNDGINWVDLTEELTNSEVSTGLSCEVIFTKNVATYRYYQMLVISSHDTRYYSLAIDELEFYEAP